MDIQYKRSIHLYRTKNLVQLNAKEQVLNLAKTCIVQNAGKTSNAPTYTVGCTTLTTASLSTY